MHVGYGTNLDQFTVDRVVNRVWESTEKHPANVSMHDRPGPRGLHEKVKCRIECILELRAQTRSVCLVPRKCVEHILDGFGAELKSNDSPPLAEPGPNFLPSGAWFARRIVQPMIELASMGFWHGNRLWSLRDAIPHVLDEADSLVQRELIDLL